jgi:hypothetical protein
MNCQNFAEISSELARDNSWNEIEATLRTDALDHLNGCAECALKLQDERALNHGLRAMATEMKSLKAPVRVEEQLLASFREIRQRSAVKVHNSESTPAWNRWIVAAAAVVLIVLGIAGVSRFASRQSQPGAAGSKNTVAISSSSSSPAMVDLSNTSKPEKNLPDDGVKVDRQKIPRRHPRSFNRDSNADRQTLAQTNAPAAKDTASEVATYFMPLGYAGPINPQDGGQLVRVELPRSAMLSMGLPVNMDRYGERVKADVLLGPDGLARAIRFVQ